MATITAETIKDSENRQKILHQLLTEMALTDSLKIRDEQIAGFASQLRDLYIPSFRHQYSKFFSMIVEIDKKMPVEGLEYLSANIILVKEFVEHNCTSGDGTYKSLYKPLMKLSDHLNLEIARYNLFYGQNAQIQGLETRYQDASKKLEDAEAKLKTIETDLPIATTELNTVKKSLASIHIDIIAVLSIFASIVLTFSGSMTVLGSALTGMQEVHALKATFFVLLCGFVLGNIIFLLMYLVGKLTSRNIYARCKTENCTCEKPCNGFKRIRKRLPYIYWLNLILIVLMAVVVVVWYLDNHYHFIH